jgi:predicted RNA-binding Zn ribbon-like protein
VSADALEALAASATLALRASLAPLRYCQACGAELPYLDGRGRPRRWCDAHHPRPSRLRRRAPQGAGVLAARP